MEELKRRDDKLTIGEEEFQTRDTLEEFYEGTRGQMLWGGRSCKCV